MPRAYPRGRGGTPAAAFVTRLDSLVPAANRREALRRFFSASVRGNRALEPTDGGYPLILPDIAIVKAPAVEILAHHVLNRPSSIGNLRLRVEMMHRLDVALMDEPETAPDAAYREVLSQHLARRRRTDRATVIATHNPALIALADRVAVFQAGTIQACDSPDRVCRSLIGGHIAELAFETAETCGRMAEALRASDAIVRTFVTGARLYAAGGNALPSWVDWIRQRERLHAQAIKKAEPSDLSKVLSWGS